MHSCPICGQACYCSGDIEDHETGEEFTGICTCCEGREDRDDDPDFEPEPDYDAPKPLTPMQNWQQNDEHNVK